MTVAQSSIPELGTAYYAYDAASHLTKKVLGNGCYTYFTYDPAGRTTQLLNCLPDGSPLAYFEYSYDAAGRIVRCFREDGDVIYYGYDLADRLTSEHWYDSSMTPLYAFQWDYDAVGNRVYQYRDGREAYYEYDEANELLHAHETSTDTWSHYSYDSRGNCTLFQEHDGTTYFTYNHANLVTSILFKEGTPNYFHYDAMQRRYAIQESTGLRYFTWDRNGMNILCERDSTDSVVVQYSHGYTPTDGIGSMAGAKDTQDGTYYQWPTYDNRGSILKLTDENDAVVGALQYDAWGRMLYEQVPITPSRFGYQSNWIASRDSAMRLWLSPSRVYAPHLGIFVQPDPQPAEGLPRTFQYVEQNPPTNTDATGSSPDRPSAPTDVSSLPGETANTFGVTEFTVQARLGLICKPCTTPPTHCAKPSVTSETLPQWTSKILDLNANWAKYANAGHDWAPPESAQAYYARVHAHEVARCKSYMQFTQCFVNVSLDITAEPCTVCCSLYLVYARARLAFCELNRIVAAAKGDLDVYSPDMRKPTSPYYQAYRKADDALKKWESQRDAQGAQMFMLLEAYNTCIRVAKLLAWL